MKIDVLKNNWMKKFLMLVMLFLLLVTCTKDQNTFLPYKPVSFYISLANYNHLTVPGNSITYKYYGFAGIIVMCVNENEYYACDACCPFEIKSGCTVEMDPIPNLSGNGLVFSSNTTGKCKCCGSEFMLFGGGFVTKGPAARPLQQYQVVNTGGRLWIHN
jgi:Rieske Fe-S protein